MRRNNIRIAAIVAASIPLCAAAAAVAGPKIQFDSKKIDFGVVVNGAPIKVSFQFKNVGDADLEITRVQPGCGCTHAEALEKKLAPGKSSSIEAVFNSTGYSGNITKSITVYTNDPDGQMISLIITGQVTTLGTLEPERLNFGSLKVNATRTRTVLVIPAAKPFAITKIESSGQQVSVPAFKRLQDENGPRWELQVLIKAGSDPGRLMETLTIRTDASDKSTLRLLVYGNLVE